MTIEEHIENLKAIASDMPSDKCSDWIESLMAGVKALEQQPCDDCISREKALQIIRAWFDREATPSDLKNEIEQLPPVTPQFGVVPMSVIEDIKAEIEEVGYAKDEYGSIRADVLRVWKVLDIIDKHISGKENK